jgi:uncharacterized protein YbjT (DUF2867 family)
MTGAKNSPPDRLILLTGATGYVGSQLFDRLASAGYRVRCLARRPEALSFLGPSVEIVAGDVLDVASLRNALAGVHTAFYLIHSMDRGEGFEDLDRRGAENFARAASAANVQRIVYLGGLADPEHPLSPHLRSRHEVGQLLRSTGVPVVELRASIVIGSGSISFEMIRALVERLPVMIAPRWVSVQAQPIAISDLLSYLQRAIEIEVDGSKTFEIGGSDRVAYGDLMRQYARQRGLRRLIIPVPVLTPRLSSLWLALVTPLYARVGRMLIESIRHPSIVKDDSALRAFSIVPMDHVRAIAEALAGEDTEWSHARSGVRRRQSPALNAVHATRLFDTRVIQINRPAEQVFAAVERIGGKVGWYYGDWLWRVRGLLDQLVGGIGLRRGRLDPVHLHVGDTVDCWRVEAIEPAHRVRLAAEMKLPGRAWLEFEIENHGCQCELRQTAEFDPRGLLGRAYWYLVYPLHQVVFAGMLRGIAHSDEKS